MSDREDWTRRSKDNPWFAKQSHVALRKDQATKPLVDFPAPAPEEV
jgi:hypothetical protein